MPSIPQMPPIGLDAQMHPGDIVAAAKASKRYHHDMDVHLLTDWLERYQENYDLLQVGANRLRDLAVAAVNGGDGEREKLAAFLFDCGELDPRPTR